MRANTDVQCPVCGAAEGEPCRRFRIPPSAGQRSHRERQTLARKKPTKEEKT